jgi:dipeptidyl aminopeptidase/acylaminoacyl peptidase
MYNFAKLTVLFAVVLIPFAAGAQTYTIQQYLNIRSCSSPTLSPDGKRLAYFTNVSGTSQIWLKDLPNGEPEQITNYNDNISFVRWSPSGTGLLFGMAKGGDENTQFYRMSDDGKGIKLLTNDPKVRHDFGAMSEDGKTIYYASNKRDKNFFDVYSMDVSSGREELIYQQDGNNEVAAVSKNGRQIIISRSGTELSLDNSLYLIDAQTHKATPLTPHTGAANFNAVEFLPDGDSIVLASDRDREFAALAQIENLRSDTENTLRFVDSAPADRDVEDIEVSPRGNIFAYTVNREGFSELNLRKIEVDGKPLISNLNFRSERVMLPAEGMVSGLTFSHDGRYLAFTFNSANHNSDIWIYDTQAQNLIQATSSDRAGIPKESFVSPTLVKFKSFDGREIPAWFYKANAKVYTSWDPKDVLYFNARGPRPGPVIVSVHGGPEGQERPVFNPLYQYYLSRGYAILATNVRGSTGYGKTYTHLDDVRKREDSVKDVAAAVDWLKTSGVADPKRIAVMGGSYGGYMTLAAITLYPDLFAAAVDTVGIANWESFLKNTSGYRRRQREVEYGSLDKDLDFLRSISPLGRVDKIKTPLFVIAGKNDPRVPYTEAEQIVGALKRRGAAVEYKVFEDEGHGVSKLKNRLELYPLVADFLDRHMNRQ